ncbi:MAG: hypothetical protein V8R80_07850 [Eubacterium sp.]
MVQARYVYLADKMKLDLVPVGMYFSREEFCFPEEKILGWDSKHPNTTGYFLAACAFYKSIFEELPQISCLLMQNKILCPNKNS